MIRTITTCFLLSLSVWISGCGPGNTAEERSPGDVAFRSRCQSCHRLPDPESKSPGQWRAWLEEHKSKAGLDSARMELILTHLTGSPEE